MPAAPENAHVNAAAIPILSSLTPNTGTVGTAVVAAGHGFGTVTGTVKFPKDTGGLVDADMVSWANNSITITVPTSAISGNVIVQLYVNLGGARSNGLAFTVI